VTLAQDRVSNGLCPRCGEEAAPYYLCSRHRAVEMVGRFLNRAEEHGAVTKERRGNKIYWSARDITAFDRVTWHSRGPELDPNDKRLRSRFGRIPVEVDKELIRLAGEIGRPFTSEEMVAAWGRLREQRKAGTIAANMAALIQAQRRREKRNARRAALARASASGT
jgi:hypothetical protein